MVLMFLGAESLTSRPPVTHHHGAYFTIEKRLLTNEEREVLCGIP